MESHGDPAAAGRRPRARPAISRRSCDQCRSRKIGCDRKSPCSNCVAAKVDCTHSAVSSSVSTTKQRVLISAQYEKKIDDIVKGIDAIKHILEKPKLSSHSTILFEKSSSLEQTFSLLSDIGEDAGKPHDSSATWDHSAHTVSLLKSVLEDGDISPSHDGAEAVEVLTSINDAIRVMEDSSTVRCQYSSEEVDQTLAHGSSLKLPPLETTLNVLRWVKTRDRYFRIARISRVLPLEYFAEVCRKIYFAVDDYNEMEFILANGYLAYVFAEHLITTGTKDYQEYWLMCRRSLRDSVSRLPLLLPASIEAIAVLTIAAYDALEDSKATLAWTWISSAASLCYTLGYHRTQMRKDEDLSRQSTRKNLFWSVYSIDRGLSLQLDRPPNIRDTDVSFSYDPSGQPRTVKLARIQGKTYDQLYGPLALLRLDKYRGDDAEKLATQLRELIREIHIELEEATSQTSQADDDPLRILYLQCHLVCHSSLLSLILRAVPTGEGSPSDASEECVAVARLTLDIHQQCMVSIRSCRTNPQIVNKYITCAILNIPFLPFSVLFLHTIRTSNVEDLVCLESFANSLKPANTTPEAPTHPHRLYSLLCKAARLHIQSDTAPTFSDHETSNLVGAVDFLRLAGLETGTMLGGDSDSQVLGLSDWYHGNQQMMALLDEGTMN